MMRAGKNEKICGGRDDNVGKCHIIGQGGAFRSSLSVLTNALIMWDVKLHRSATVRYCTYTSHFQRT